MYSISKGEYLELKIGNERRIANGEKYTTKNFIICTLYLI
jgi:uncharacterized protein YegP (UPF0339 family)